jgi:hypothetical protein
VWLRAGHGRLTVASKWTSSVPVGLVNSRR